MRRILIVLIVVVILAAGGAWIYQSYFAQQQDPQQEREEVTVERGTLTSMVNATGTILPEKQTALSFKTPGRVARVLAEEGQTVNAGDELARLETTDLEFAVAQAGLSVEQAELALASAQAQLLWVQRATPTYDIAAAEAALESAQASYRKLLAGPTKDEIRVARANLDQAKVSLDQAQAAYDQVADRPDVALLPQSVQLEQATIAYQVAQANFALTMRDPSEAEIAAAQSAIRQAEASLDRLKEGAADEDLVVSQLAVGQAEVALEQAKLSRDQAQHNLEGTVIAAPHGGTITLVGVKEGEISGGQPAFILTDLSQYHVDVTVDEIDIGRVQEEQLVTITLDALPGEILGGKVDMIADSAQLDTGVVTYKVTVRLEPSTAPLRVGMTANVDIVTERREQVLLVPNRFVRIDRTTGQAYVDKLAGAEIQPVEIQIGLRDEVYSEVLAGLEQGDVVVLVKESSREQLQQMMMGGPPR